MHNLTLPWTRAHDLAGDRLRKLIEDLHHVYPLVLREGPGYEATVHVLHAKSFALLHRCTDI